MKIGGECLDQVIALRDTEFLKVSIDRSGDHVDGTSRRVCPVLHWSLLFATPSQAGWLIAWAFRNLILNIEHHVHSI